MFGDSAFGVFAFAEHSHTPADTSAFEAFLAEVNSPRCWLLEIEPFSLAGDLLAGTFSGAGFGELAFSAGGDAEGVGLGSLYYSTHGFNSRSTDTPASTHYPAVLQPPRVERMILGGVAGLARVAASIELVNRDGAFDLLTEQYALDGRRVQILIGRGADRARNTSADARADFGVLFTGVVRNYTVGDVFTLELSDGIAKLELPINPDTYTGAGSLEGGDDLKGKSKPVALGYCWNVPGPLVLSASLIYQVHNGAINDVPAAYDRQILLTQGADYTDQADLLANAPSAGQYRVLKSGGYVRLGSTPAGTVTFDVEGDASGAGFVSTTADIVLRILATYAGLTSTELDPTSFGRLNSLAGASVGRWLGTEPVNMDRVIDELLAGVGAFGGFNRQGAFSVGLVAAAAGETEVATLTERDIVGLERIPLPPHIDPVTWRARVGWQRLGFVQTDVAAAVDAARRTYAAEPTRYAEQADASIRSRRLLAKDLAVDALYAEESDADTEAQRLYDLWSSARAMFTVKTRLKALTRDLGQVIRIEHPRHGFAAGKPARVLGHEVVGSDVELTVLV